MKKLLKKLNLLEIGLPTDILISKFLIWFLMPFVFLLQISCKKERAFNSIIHFESYELNDSSLKLQENFSDELLLKAIYHINKEYELKLFEEPIEIDYMSFNQMIHQTIKNNSRIVDSLLFVLQYQSYHDFYIRILNNWCEDFILLEIPSKTEQPSIFFEEIIYVIPMTNHVVLSFLSNEKQDWSSLSETQIYELPYRVCDYLSILDVKQRVYFYSVFFNILEKKLNE